MAVNREHPHDVTRAHDLFQLYRKLPTPELLALRRAFLMDRKRGARLPFCATRLQLIEEILDARDKRDPISVDAIKHEAKLSRDGDR